MQAPQVCATAEQFKRFNAMQSGAREQFTSVMVSTTGPNTLPKSAEPELVKLSKLSNVDDSTAKPAVPGRTRTRVVDSLLEASLS
jgi:hypothetical protein